MKEVLCHNARFYVDHDFPSKVLKKRGEYAEAKKVLKEKQIKTPYPAKVHIFYNDGTRLYQDAAEATRDMVSRGFSVAVVKSSSTPDQEEIGLLSTWQQAAGRRDRHGDQPDAGDGCAQPKRKLQQFRRQVPVAGVTTATLQKQISGISHPDGCAPH